MKTQNVLLRISSSLFWFSVGDFDIRETGHGKIAEFNLWDYVISPRAIESVTCGASGNIVSWNTLKEMGVSNKYYNNRLVNCGKLPYTYV